MEIPKAGRFIDPFTDWGFKRIFGSEPHKDLLIDFLNQLFLGERKIIDLVYNKNEHPGHLPEHRKAVFDLLCTGSNGEQFIIEVQRVKQEFFKDRCIYYAASLIRDQVPTGVQRWDYQLKPVYLIGLMDFEFGDTETDECLHRVQLTEVGTIKIFYDKIGFIFIEMPKFIKDESALVSELDNWLFLLKNLSKLDKIPILLRKPVFSKLFNIAEVSNLDTEEKMAYDTSLKEKWDYYNSLDYVQKEGFDRGERKGFEAGIQKGIETGLKRGIERGIEQGIEQGIERGIEQGIEKGFEKGKKEEKRIIARSMKQKGMELRLISELLDLSIDELEKL